MPATRGLRTAITALIVVLMLGGCGQYPDYPRSDMTQQQQFDELMQRPTLEDAVARYKQMREKILQRLGDELGLTGWHEKTEPGGVSNGCNDFYKVHAWDAATQYMDSWILPRRIPDDQWDRALEIVMEVGGSYGFATTTIATERAGYRQVYVNDQWGAQLGIGTAVHSSLSIRTGCHLHAEAHQRGTPRPIPTYG